MGNRIQVAFDLTDSIEDEAHVDTLLQIVESAMNLRFEQIADGKGQLTPIDWLSLLCEQYFRMTSTINRVSHTVQEGDVVPERHIHVLISSLININAYSLGALQNLTYKDLSYGNEDDTTPSTE